ncbi:SAM-dependent DNA methyltransferase [Clostridium perfringens]|uniref:type I restriction-modification system subunit M n=1 Tax=Clostridium perfringens TaxID=1502 RepID=UPI0013E353A3|nr:class I SAM-dependent DNA methyltransferase [Clostridium perfringens]ELU5587711.1 SAM-dependent DNA methyltransferase [Clostridium perfringens]NGT58459.1 SAM-dependent DNA methyltransferase [Clostridium perfringens]NGT94755.1 SAM-dependent DNA methyltransferase [Clostridium perfringens]
MSEDTKMKQTTINISEKANLIWNIADIIGQGLYKPHEYGKIILPMTVIKRFNDTLMPTKQAVLDMYEKVKHFEVKDGFLESASGYSFYNISPFTFSNLVDDSEHIEANFRAFLAGFSENVQDVLENFEFDKEITKLANNGMLFLIIQEFNKKNAYMGADVISSTDMGYIFEELVRRFSESYNEQAGAHFTSRDIIYLMTDLLIAEEKDALIEEGVVKTVYDQTMGTSQMLGCMEERLKLLDEEAEVSLFGQELNPETYAIAKADMLIKGGKADNMRQGNTLSDDKFKNYKFDYCISNPPFGIDWKVEKKAVEAEAKLGDMGRFGVGLPKINDGQQLFDLNGLDKLKDTGRMAIIHNSSPLYSGDAGSGPSEIRRYIIENDWLEAIIQLSTDSFYNTEIPTYIWIMTKNKPANREGKIQLIDASNMYERRRKAIGKKKNDITEECRDIIVKAYGEFENKIYTLGDKTCESRIFDNIEFGYNKIVVESPQLDEEGNTIIKKNKPIADSSKRDTENIPLVEDIDRYFDREVLPYNPEAWIDKKKTKVGYEIPFARYFYKYEEPERADDIAIRINKIENNLMASLKLLFSEVNSINE